MSALNILATSLSVLALYILGARYIGRPLAELSWKLWDPEARVTPLFYVLYPRMAWLMRREGMTFPVQFLQIHRAKSWLFPPFVFEDRYLLHNEEGETEEPLAEEAVRLRYVKTASLLWPLRFLVLPVLHLSVLISFTCRLLWQVLEEVMTVVLAAYLAVFVIPGFRLYKMFRSPSFQRSLEKVLGIR